MAEDGVNSGVGVKVFHRLEETATPTARRYMRQETERLKAGETAFFQEAEKLGLERDDTSKSLDRLKVTQGKPRPSNEDIRKLTRIGGTVRHHQFRVFVGSETSPSVASVVERLNGVGCVPICTFVIPWPRVFDFFRCVGGVRYSPPLFFFGMRTSIGKLGHNCALTYAQE